MTFSRNRFNCLFLGKTEGNSGTGSGKPTIMKWVGTEQRERDQKEEEEEEEPERIRNKEIVDDLESEGRPLAFFRVVKWVSGWLLRSVVN